jgi:spore coat polysaccharide biosynthesis protein SpsF (cytidylyltransferase family)
MQERLSGKVMDVVKKNALIPYKIKEAKKKKKEREKKGDMYKKYSTLYIYGDLSTNRKNTE